MRDSSRKNSMPNNRVNADWQWTLPVGCAIYNLNLNSNTQYFSNTCMLDSVGAVYKHLGIAGHILDAHIPGRVVCQA